MSRPRKPVELILQNEAEESIKSGSGFCISQNSLVSLCQPTLPFYDSIKSSFKNWLDRQKNRKPFDSVTQIRYR